MHFWDSNEGKGLPSSFFISEIKKLYIHHITFNAGINESLSNSFCITIFYFSQNNLILYQTPPTPDRFKRKTDQLYGPNKFFCCYTVFHLQTEFFLSIIIFFNITQWAPPVLRFFAELVLRQFFVCRNNGTMS